MALKREIATLDDVPEALRAAYVERDGKFLLDIDGGGDDGLKGALEKERKARGDAEKMLRDIKAKLGDTDPAKAREALRMLAELEDKAALGDLPPSIMAKVDELAAKRAERGITEARTQADQEKTRAAELESRLKVLISDRIRAACAKAGVRATAADDVVMVGERVFKLKDGEPVPMNGEEVMFGKDSKPMSPEEWLAERAKDKPHWFEPSSGAGASTTTKAGGSGAVVLTREQAKNVAAYRAAKEQATKQGVDLVIQ